MPFRSPSKRSHVQRPLPRCSQLRFTISPMQ
jgi:hypothetical protein